MIKKINILKLQEWIIKNKQIEILIKKAEQLRIFKKAYIGDLPGLKKSAYHFSEEQLKYAEEKLDEALAKESENRQRQISGGSSMLYPVVKKITTSIIK